MSASEPRAAVVLELAEEFLERYRQGQRPSLKEYIDRHPELAAEIKEVFPAMAMMENVALADESLVGAATGEAPTTGNAPPEQLGDFRILREVGRGGMGIVYEAEQISLGRHVALKVLPRKVLLDAAQKRRFEREARSAAKLHHTNIVPVFGVGEHEGLPYYVMQFIQGLGLHEVLDELKRLYEGGAAAARGGELCVARKNVSAVDVARSLMTGGFPQAPDHDVPSKGEAEAEDSDTGKLSDSFKVSSAAATLPGSDTSHGRVKKSTYWQSVARIGVQVAGALDYARKQGIQHRDIKPSNLLLDTRGTVWVTDFGLARADNEDHLTQTGDLVGTLRYMPPEAFEGRTDARGDLYSLGLTLYELLALRPAFAEKDRHKLIKQVTTAEPARLDNLNRAIPRDLATIVHKAIDREPAHRYQTAEELAADLQRFLDDEPIRARRISSGERLLRWCRHYPGVASLTGVLALILLAVTVASLFAAARFDGLARDQAATAENERQARLAADEAKEHETALRKQAEDAKTQAETNLQEAKWQKQRADANFAKARKAVDDYFTAISESQLLKVPGMQPLRGELLQWALAFYQDFLKERADDPAVRGDLAAAYLRIGKIRAELGEGAEARNAYEQARGLYQALTKAAPESVEWRHGLAQCAYGLDRYDEAIALWQKLVQAGQPRFQKELADAYNYRAIKYTNAGKYAEALEANQQALAIREMLVRLNPEDANAQRDLGGTLNNIGVLLSKKQRLAEALAMYRRAAEHGEAAFTQAPQVILNGRSLAVSQSNIAVTEHRLRHVNEALAAYRRVVEVRRKLARDNPAVPSLHSALFGAYRNLALYQRELKQDEPYKQTMRLAREVIDRLPSDGPDALFDLACVRAACLTFLGSEKDKPSNEEQAEQKREADLAMEVLRKALAAGLRDLERLRNAPELNALRGREDFKALEADLAARVAATPPDKLKKSQQALALRQKLAQADPKNKRLQADLAASQHAIALILLDLGKLEEAGKHLQQAIALRAALVQDEPKDGQYQADLAASRFALGDFHWRSGRLAEGAKLLREELGKLEAAARAGAVPSFGSGQLLAMRRTVAQHYARAGLWPEAAAQYERLLPLEGTADDDYYRAACLALRAGDVAAYRRIGAHWVQRVGDSDNPFRIYFLIWLSSLADRSGVEPSQVLQWLRKTTGRELPKEWWRCHILGLAHYRAGRFAEAIAQAQRSNLFDASKTTSVMNYPVLALAHHRLGHAAEARDWLDKARAEWRRLSPLHGAISSPTVVPAIQKHHWEPYWHDWVTFELLFLEAARTIVGSPPVEEAYHRAHRGWLYSRLGEVAQAEAEWEAAVTILPREPRIWLIRARQLAESKRNKEAEAALATVEEFASDDPEVWKERGRLRFEFGQRDKAAADFRKAVELLGDKTLPSNPAESESDKLFARLADDALLPRLTAAIERGPENVTRRWQRGEWYARHSRWKEAAVDFTLALERNPRINSWEWLHAAPALAASGDRAAYQGHCREMRKRFGDTQDPSTADRVAKACLLLPEAADGVELAYQLADRAAALGKDHPWTYWFLFGKGLADYRRGNLRAAVQELDALTPRIPPSIPELNACRHLIQAMALHRQGEAKAAREHLAAGAKLLDRHVHDPTRFPTLGDKLGEGSAYNQDWLIAWLLHREAQTLIEGTKAGPKK